jgi:undecaprenyl-diphosphatase
VTLEIVLHAGTLLSVLLVYRRDLALLARQALEAARALPSEGLRGLARARELAWLALATVPAALAGLLLGRQVEAVFQQPRTTALLLCVTGLLLLASELRRRARGEVNGPRALAMGGLQALSLLPGISRCGATYVGGVLAGGRPERVVRFSFLMSVPAIAGALALHLRELADLSLGSSWPAYLAGFVTAVVFGLLAIRLLLRVVARGRMLVFAVYCLIVGVAGWLYLGANGPTGLPR